MPLASLGQGLLKFDARLPGGHDRARYTLNTTQLNGLTTGFNNNTKHPQARRS